MSAHAQFTPALKRQVQRGLSQTRPTCFGPCCCCCQQHCSHSGSVSVYISAMGSDMDFQLDWDLPAYPQLPKMFTNAKAAKKRKHRVFVMTDADLEHVVKIPRAATGALAREQSQH